MRWRGHAEISGGDLRGAAEHPLDLVVGDTDHRDTVEHGGHRWDGAGRSDHGVAALQTFEVGGFGKAEGAVDRGFHGHDGHTVGHRRGDLVAHSKDRLQHRLQVRSLGWPTVARSTINAPVIDALNATWDAMIAEGQPFAMTETEVRGIPMRVFTSAPPDMRFIWEMSAGHGDKPYLVFEDEEMSYGEAHATVRSLAAYLVEQGVQPGDRVAIAMRNYPEWALSYWATICIGAAAVGVNAWWTPPSSSTA